MLLLTNVELVSVRLNDGTVVEHDIITDSPFCHLTSDRLTLALWMQFTLLDLVKIALYDFNRDRSSVCIILETFW